MALHVDGDVEFVKVTDGLEDKSCLARCGALEHAERQFIAAGGFGSEFVLYERGLTVNSDGEHLTEKEFIDASNDSASHDKPMFFGADLTEDGEWPAELDRQFMKFAIDQCAPHISANFEAVRRLVDVLASEKMIDKARILEEL